MYKVWIKNNDREIQSIGEDTYKILVERLCRMVLVGFTFLNILRFPDVVIIPAEGYYNLTWGSL